jgi:hypothetical protein
MGGGSTQLLNRKGDLEDARRMPPYKSLRSQPPGIGFSPLSLGRSGLQKPTKNPTPYIKKKYSKSYVLAVLIFEIVIVPPFIFFFLTSYRHYTGVTLPSQYY